MSEHEFVGPRMILRREARPIEQLFMARGAANALAPGAEPEIASAFAVGALLLSPGIVMSVRLTAVNHKYVGRLSELYFKLK